MIGGCLFGLVRGVSFSKAVRKYKKDEAEALRNECAHHIHRSVHHNIHDR